ncbi:facilitated trehalose transporter Tret1-like isoform X2 [Venturia canescens]|uniref:facilitated trehalose transporter Tret1-like isoform X2 n=1 Tax=Venturia canescens TaxID=32260 RepID=UPI001C9D41DB|nr:facilitated trehalose transporter Tret1-like isoform X2 [Venturia canescens]
MAQYDYSRSASIDKRFEEVLASCIVHCIVIQAGVNMAYSTILIGGLQAENDVKNLTNNASNVNPDGQQIIIDKNDESWIASLVTITLPIGSLMAGPFMDKFGRKTMCIALCVPTMISWIVLIVSRSLMMIYVARCLAGMSAGLTSVGLVYVIEITHPRIRAMLLCLNSVFVSLGILLACFFALWLEWRQVAMLFLALNFIIFFALFVVPESPYWLLCFAHGSQDPKRIARAEKSLRWFNPQTWMYEQEYARIKETSRSNDIGEEESSGWGKFFLTRFKYYSREMAKPTIYKPMMMLFVILLMQQLSGAYVVIFYAISVFKEIGGTFGDNLDEYGALLLLGIIRFIMSILTAHLSRTIGRRTLCIASGLGMSFAMFFSAMLVYLTFAPSDASADNSVTSLLSQQKWLLLVVVLFYVCMSTLGFVVIPWTLIGELLPISFRGIGGGIMISYTYVVMFAVVKSYPHALYAVGPQNVFFFFSLMSLLGTGYIYLFLPETLGKSLKQIEHYFASQ